MSIKNKINNLKAWAFIIMVIAFGAGGIIIGYIIAHDIYIKTINSETRTCPYYSYDVENYSEENAYIYATTPDGIFTFYLKKDYYSLDYSDFKRLNVSFDVIWDGRSNSTEITVGNLSCQFENWDDINMDIIDGITCRKVFEGKINKTREW